MLEKILEKLYKNRKVRKICERINEMTILELALVAVIGATIEGIMLAYLSLNGFIDFPNFSP